MKEQFKDGVYDITNDQYHGSEGISRSQLMLLDKSPYHYWFSVISGLAPSQKETPAMAVGSAFHTLLLEPHLFEYEYCVAPKVDRRTSAGKEEWAAFMERSQGQTVLTDEQYNQAFAMAHGVKQHEAVTLLLADAVYEQSIFWTDKATGLQFKVRPDVWSEKMVVDIKTAADVATYKFKNACLEHGYYLQAAMIYEACKAIGKPIEIFSHLVVEKEEPYAPKVFVLSDRALQYGIDQFMIYKERLAECYATNRWEAYRVEELDVAEYAAQRLEQEL